MCEIEQQEPDSCDSVIVNTGSFGRAVPSGLSAFQPTALGPIFLRADRRGIGHASPTKSAPPDARLLAPRVPQFSFRL
jgi:hypothetical protein